MNLPSRRVESSQKGPHPRLIEIVEKHKNSVWHRPLSDSARRSFDQLEQRVGNWRGQRILDTGCGTGRGTLAWATKEPDALVIGVDKSSDRLDRIHPHPENVLLVRMNLEDFWPLAKEAGWTFSRQLFLYPNPWPKPEQRLRRWAFHPVLPAAYSCGGVWEVRTNWEVYAQEMALAHAQFSGFTQPVCEFYPLNPLTAFEKKYAESQHKLWRWISEFPEIPSKKWRLGP